VTCAFEAHTAATALWRPQRFLNAKLFHRTGEVTINEPRLSALNCAYLRARANCMNASASA